MNTNKSNKKSEDTKSVPPASKKQQINTPQRATVKKPAPVGPKKQSFVSAGPKVAPRGIVHADAHFAPLVLGVHGTTQRAPVKRPKDAVFWKPLNQQLQKTYAHLKLPGSVFGLPEASAAGFEKRAAEAPRMTQGLRDLLQKVVRAYVEAGHEGGFTNQQLAEWISTNGDVGENSATQGLPLLYATGSVWSSIQATLSNLVTYSAGAVPAALLGLATGMSVGDVLLGLLNALGMSSLTNFVSILTDADGTGGEDDSIDYLVAALTDDVTAGNTLKTLQKFNTWVDTYNAEPQKELLDAMANAGTQGSSFEEAGDSRGEAPYTDDASSKAYKFAVSATDAAERIAGVKRPIRGTVDEQIAYNKAIKGTTLAGIRQAARDAIRAESLAKNPYSKGTQIGVTASGNEITQLHNRPTSITPLMSQDGLYGMHVTGSQLLCTAGGFTGGQQMVFGSLPGGDGCQLPFSGYLTQKGIAMNPQQLGFFISELSVNWSQFRIDEFEICVGTRVGTSTEGLWVLAYASDGATQITAPGGPDLTGSVCASMTNATMLNAYTSCGAAQNMGDCWRLPRHTSTNNQHWFYIEGERDGESNYNTAVARNTIDGWICGAQAVDITTAEDKIWQVVGCRYSISFCDPAFQTMAPVARNIKNSLGPLIAPGFLAMLEDPLLVCGMAWLLGFSLSPEGSKKEMEELVNNMRLLFPGFIPPDATPDTLMPKFFAYQQKLGPPPGVLSRCGWKPSGDMCQFALLGAKGAAPLGRVPPGSASGLPKKNAAQPMANAASSVRR